MKKTNRIDMMTITMNDDSVNVNVHLYS